MPDLILSPADQREFRRMVSELMQDGDDFERAWRLSKQISDDSRSEMLQKHADRLARRDNRIRALQATSIGLTLVLAASWVVIAWLVSVVLKRM